jgi:hypothetical protein
MYWNPTAKIAQNTSEGHKSRPASLDRGAGCVLPAFEA